MDSCGQYTLSPDDKILTTTWAMKKKTSGIFPARVNARGYEQVDGIHYDSSHTAAPVTNDVTICIMFTVAMMAKWSAYLIDINSAFLMVDLKRMKDYTLRFPKDLNNTRRAHKY